MKKIFRKSLGLLLLLSVFFTITGCEVLSEDDMGTVNTEVESPSGEPDQGEESSAVKKDGYYTGKEEVAEYIHIYRRLPDNYITKNEAMDLGWDADRGNLWDVTDEMSIGGDRFGNREGLLPDASGRKWYEADIDYDGGRRNAKRIVFSNDGLIYYTDDHYESFEQLY